MGSEEPQLHIFLFPFMAHGHMIPTIDLAKLFASRGVRATIVTTPLNEVIFSKPVQGAKDAGMDIEIRFLKFPAAEVGIPEGYENMNSITSHKLGKELMMKFFTAMNLLQEPLEKLLEECRPDCLVADMFFPWATNAAAKFGIPRLMFHGTSSFALCAQECVKLYRPHEKVSSDSEPFLIPSLPGCIQMTRKELPDSERENLQNDFIKTLEESREQELKSFGVVVNTFYELEPAYADHYSNVLGRKAWHIGPLALCSREIEEKARRGEKSAAAVDEHECLKWLDSKKSNSVVYVCFGSLSNFPIAQLMELAMALEDSGQQFIWVVRRNKNDEGNEEWLPEGFEKRMEGKGLIIRGWAPQVMILDHHAIGGFVTHCGWNSILEAASAGIPMVTWPVFAEQFYNEKLVNQVLKIGVGVGVQEWSKIMGDFVKKEAIEKAVKEIMVGDRAEDMRNKAKTLKEMARKAIKNGGSSDSDLNALIQELKIASPSKHWSKEN